MTKDNWLHWTRELQSIANAGLTYSTNPYDIERFKQLQKLACEITSKYLDMDQTKLFEIFENEKHYITPKIDVRGAIFKDDKILLVKESQDNKWSLPGGWADVNLSPKENIIKEIEEETGFIASVIKLISVEDNLLNNVIDNIWHSYKLFFLCEITSGSITPSIETLEIDFFDINNLPELSEVRIVKKQINRCFEHYYNQNLLTYFD